jgi:hypothetical protein
LAARLLSRNAFRGRVERGGCTKEFNPAIGGVAPIIALFQRKEIE